MGRTPLFSALQKQLKDLGTRRESEQGEAVDSRGNADRGRLINRRSFLGLSAGAIGAMVLPRAVFAGKRPSQSKSVAIVGAGLAGLGAAMTLVDAGYAVTVYEAAESRVGGRTQADHGSAQNILTGGSCGICHDARKSGDSGYWEDDQVTDMFGEMIDTGHTTMISLAKRFGLPLIDSIAAQPAGSTDTYYFSKGYYPAAQGDADFAIMFDRLQRDLTETGYPTTYNSSKPAGRALDAMSIYDWIETRVPGGHASPLGKILDIAYAIEFGADTTDQSALSLVYLLGYSAKKSLSLYGESDERYRIKGGSWELSRAMANSIGWDASIKFGHWLTALARNSDGTSTLTFDKPGAGTTSVRADYVLLALPFAVLRNLDYRNAGFDPLKQRAIQELGRGVNGKLQLQFKERYWNRTGAWGKGNGNSYSDTGFQNTWEPTRGIPGACGVLLKYTGGTPVTALSQKHPYGNATNPAAVADAKKFLTELEPVFPGISASWNGKVAGSMPHFEPRFGCSYSYWRVGQYTAFAGYEGKRQGNVFFAGEHTSLDFQGWMEGAARTGVSAGNDIISALRGR